MIQTKAPQWKEQLEATRNPLNSHSQGLLTASHSQGYPSGRLTPTHLDMVRGQPMDSLCLGTSGAAVAPSSLQTLLPCPASIAFPGQDEGTCVYGLLWGRGLDLMF